MNRKMTRRSFLKSSAAIGAGALVSAPLLLEAGARPDIAVVTGGDALAGAAMAVKKLGGMGRFVAKNARVAILANAQRNNPGVYTHPDVIRSVIRMCRQAGAGAIHFLSWLPLGNWEATGQKAAIEEEGAQLVLVGREDPLFRPRAIEKGIALKEARIMEEFFKYDVFINMPITKDHAGNKFTGTMKNLMGLNSPQNNRAQFHRPDWQSNPESIRHLDQCIADLNLLFPPHLCVVDATEFIITDGPMGPGKLLAPHKIVAGTDRVAIDAYCCGLWGLDPAGIQTIALGHVHGLGQIDLKRVKIKEYRV